MARRSARAARARYERVRRRSRPGSGARFAALTEAIAARGGVRDPRAVAAAIGRRKWGARRMAQWAAAGRRRRGRRAA
jgi:hypothetical protein